MRFKGNLQHLSRAAYLQVLPRLKEEKVQALTTLYFTLVAISIFGFFAISPTLSTIVKLQKKLKDNQNLYEKLQEKNTNLKTLQEKYNVLEKDLIFVLSNMPAKPEVPILLAQLQGLAKLHNINVISLRANEVELTKEEENKYSSFAFSFGGEGSYNDILSFLTSISNFDRIVSIDTTGITFSEKNGNTQISLTGKAYFKI